MHLWSDNLLLKKDNRWIFKQQKLPTAYPKWGLHFKNMVLQLRIPPLKWSLLSKMLIFFSNYECTYKRETQFCKMTTLEHICWIGWLGIHCSGWYSKLESLVFLMRINFIFCWSGRNDCSDNVLTKSFPLSYTDTVLFELLLSEASSLIFLNFLFFWLVLLLGVGNWTPLLVHLRHVQGFRGLSFDSCRGCIELAFNWLDVTSCQLFCL